MNIETLSNDQYNQIKKQIKVFEKQNSIMLQSKNNGKYPVVFALGNNYYLTYMKVKEYLCKETFKKTLLLVKKRNIIENLKNKKHVF